MIDKEFYDCIENDHMKLDLWKKSKYEIKWLFDPYNPKFFDSIGVHIVDTSRIDGKAIVRINTDKQYRILTKYFNLRFLDRELEDHIPRFFSALTSDALAHFYKIQGFKNKNSRTLLERKEKLENLYDKHLR